MSCSCESLDSINKAAVIANEDVANVAAPVPAVPGVRCSNVAQSDLTTMVGCLYPVGQPYKVDDLWHTLTKESQEDAGTEVQWVAWNKESKKECITDEAKPLAQESLNSAIFAKVSVKLACVEKGDTCSITRTETWTIEDGKWRRVILINQLELLKKMFDSGDYTGAVANANEYLKKDPFSVPAYSNMIYSISRGARLSDNRGTRDIVRALLAINPSDSMAIVVAASFSYDISIAKTILRKFNEDDCNRKVAIFNIAQLIRSPSARLKFLLENDDEKSPSLMMQKAVTAFEAREFELVRSILIEDNEKLIREDLDTNDSFYAGHWAAMLGLAQLAVGNKQLARAWLDYSVLRDPTGPEVKKLARKLRQ